MTKRALLLGAETALGRTMFSSEDISDWQIEGSRPWRVPAESFGRRASRVRVSNLDDRSNLEGLFAGKNIVVWIARTAVEGDDLRSNRASGAKAARLVCESCREMDVSRLVVVLPLSVSCSTQVAVSDSEQFYVAGSREDLPITEGLHALEREIWRYAADGLEVVTVLHGLWSDAMIGLGRRQERQLRGPVQVVQRAVVAAGIWREAAVLERGARVMWAGRAFELSRVLELWQARDQLERVRRAPHSLELELLQLGQRFDDGRAIRRGD